MSGKEICWHCPWCFHIGHSPTQEWAEREYRGHVDWCRPRYLIGSIKVAADVAVHRVASGRKDAPPHE